MFNIKSKIILLSIILVFSLILTACQGPSSNTGSTPNGNGGSKGSIKIGAIFPLSGPLALLGEESFRGVEVAVDKINKNGGINGKTIELIAVDTPSANEAMASAQKLVTQDKVNLVVGSFESTIVPIAAQITERNKVPYFELGSVADEVTEQGHKYLFRTNPPSYMYAESDMEFIKYLSDKWGTPLQDLKVAFIHEDSSWGTSIKDDFLKLAKKENVNVVDVVSYNMGTVKSVDSQVLSLKKSNPDVVIGVSYIDDSILVVRTMNKLAFKPKAFIGQGGGYSLPNLKKAVGDAVDGLFNIDFTQYNVNPDVSPGLEEYVKLYEEKFGSKPLSGHSLTNFYGAETTFSILKEAKSLDAEDIRKAANATNIENGKTSTGWGVKFDEKGQNTLCLPFSFQYQNQELVSVWPENAAVAEIK
ncbi:ABC transporter substrate-binding protein [Bacillus sp. M6-12]|uniref:ABC transporter substrate-binding protein n=1 Tax=Bacillus sp. M6-12 TaxID=2054166 RepID=UPI0015E10716|nr:ABC transporter substrate-binding protein [Bacillus sp. M6-12]